MGYKDTKHDLCAHTVTLDYQALVATAKVAYTLGLRTILKCYTELSEPIRYEDIQHSWSCIQARNLADESERFVVVAQTLAALMEGLDRERVKVVNKPKVTEELEGGQTDGRTN
jgi:hypothetical protein